jgi:hypothetical protein
MYFTAFLLLSLGTGTFAACGSPSEGGTSTSTSTGTGTTDPGSCLLADNRCVVDSDCPMGSRCNVEVEIPQCETLYCGALGSLCSDPETCKKGLACDRTWGGTASVCCAEGGDPCAQDGDCCSTDGLHATCQGGVCNQTCGNEGEPCLSGTCCAGLKCYGGGTPCEACTATGAACTTDEECCTEGDSCDNGICKVPCSVGNDCSAGCCQGLVCNEDKNTCELPPPVYCNPLHDTQCDVAAGEFCSYMGIGFMCVKHNNPAPTVGLCEDCGSAYCQDGTVCLPAYNYNGGSQCMRYCCTSADCGGDVCYPASSFGAVVFGTDVGVCALSYGGGTLDPTCSGIPTPAPSKGACHTLGM